MIETLYVFTQTDTRLVERLIDDGTAMINHVVLPAAEALPEHDSNANTYLLVLRGVLSLQLAAQPVQQYPAGSIVQIPTGTRMSIANRLRDPLEFFIVKAPSPGAEGNKA